MKIELTEPEHQLLVSSQEVPLDIQNLLNAEGVKSGQCTSLEIKDDIADRLRDICGEMLQTSGFDGNYKPNERGLLLEGLIDKLFPG